MKQISILLLTTLFLCPAMAQNSKNSRADAIVGTYRVEHAGQQSKVRVYKEKNGDYTAQCIWLRDSIDPATGKLLRTNVHYDAYTLWRLSVTQRICKAFKLSVTLDNIFNYNPTYHYFNSPFTNGTTIQAGLSIDLDML